MLRVTAPAKINLFLHVGDKRKDGFHDLQSLVVFAEIGDVLRVEPADDLSLSIEGRFAGGLSAGADNLIMRAAHALSARAPGKPGARFVLEKNLPVASGIGGGSADAAAAMRALVELWKLCILHDDLLGIAASLGSDVPVCVKSKPAWMEGRGERLTPAGTVPNIAMVLLNPGVPVSTAQIFQNLKTRSGTGQTLGAMTDADRAQIAAYAARYHNDLEAPARALTPQIDEMLAALAARGTTLARMSGSGATCFGLFDNDAHAHDAAKVLSRDHPDWWVVATRIAGADIGAVKRL